MIDNLYHYRAKVIDVYDGDSIKVEIDLGFGVHQTPVTLRLYGLNAPEVRGAQRQEGLVSRDWLRAKILGEKVTIKTIRDKKGKYGRYLAVVFLGDQNINDQLVAEGLAEYKVY